MTTKSKLSQLLLLLLSLGASLLLFARQAKPVCADSCPSYPGGDITITENCAFTGNTEGVDAGTLRVATNKSLTVNANQTIAWSPGNSIIIEPGASIAINSGSQLKQTYLWFPDENGDGFLDPVGFHGAVAVYHMDEASGTNVMDSTGNNNGTATGTSVVTGEFGSGRSFTVTTDKITTSATSALNTDTHTIAFWLKLTQTAPAYWGQVLAFRPTGTDRSPGIWVYNGQNCLHWRYDPGNTGVNCGGPTGGSSYFTVGTWYHIAGVKNGSSFAFYVNGSSVATPSVANPKTAGTAAIEIGQTGSNAGIFDIDELQIFNRALSLDEIKALYEPSFGGVSTRYAATAPDPTKYKRRKDISPSAGTVGHWKMDESANDSCSGGQDACDSASTNHAIANNTTILTPISSPKPKFGNARNFNGSSDYLYISASPNTSVSNWTLSAWINPANLSQLGMAVYNGNNSGGYGFGVGNGAGAAGSKLQGLFGNVAWLDSGYTFASANTWYHVVMTRDSSTTKFYVNGAQTANTSSSTPGTISAKFSMGMQYNASNVVYRYFAGAIDDVRIYPFPLTDHKIKELYYNGTISTCSSSASNTWTDGSYYVDADGDGIGAGSLVSACTGGSTPGGHSTTNTDCNDSNNAVYQNLTGYQDSDSDTYTTGGAQQICSGASLPSGWRTAANGSDCKDTGTSANQVWTSAGTACWTDADGDTYTTTQTTKNCLNTSSCATATYASTGSNDDVASYTAGRLKAAANGSDCKDTGTSANQVWQSVGTACWTDADGDTYTTTQTTKNCLNTSACTTATYASTGSNEDVASYTAGRLRAAANGSDCNDADATRWVNRYADSDVDNYGAGSAVCVGSHAGYVDNNTDCASADATLWQNLTCYNDTDNDGSSAGASHTVCVGSACNSPPGHQSYANAPADCDDNNAYIDLKNSSDIIPDEDQDGWATGSTVSGNQTQCIGGWEGVGGRDYRRDSSGNYTWLVNNDKLGNNDCATTDGTRWVRRNCCVDADNDTFTAPCDEYVSFCKGSACNSPTGHQASSSSPSDCYDSNASAKPGQTLYFDTNRGDGSFDYDCNGSATKQCNTVTTLGTKTCATGAPSGVAGFVTSVPACGSSGTYKTCKSCSNSTCTTFCTTAGCGAVCPGGTYHEITSSTSVSACR